MQQDKKSECAQALLKKLARVTARVHKHQSSARSYGTDEKLYMREMHFLELLSQGESEMSVIAQKLDVTNGAASQIAARLERKAYIVRQKDSQDHRFIICSATEKAQKVLAYHRQFDQRGFAQFEQVLEDFSMDDLQRCDCFLDKILDLYALSKTLESE